MGFLHHAGAVTFPASKVLRDNIVRGQNGREQAVAWLVVGEYAMGSQDRSYHDILGSLVGTTMSSIFVPIFIGQDGKSFSG